MSSDFVAFGKPDTADRGAGEGILTMLTGGGKKDFSASVFAF